MRVEIAHLHTPEKAREIVEHAYNEAAEITSDPGEWPHVFGALVNLLGNVYAAPMMPTGGVLDMSQLRGKH